MQKYKSLMKSEVIRMNEFTIPNYFDGLIIKTTTNGKDARAY